MITLEGSNIKILRVDYDKWCIEVVDLDNNMLFNGTDVFDVIREREKPTKVVLYHYTAKPVDKPLIIRKLKEENEWLKKSIKRQQLSNEECSKYIEEVVKENEQLKSTNMEMEDYLGRLEEQIICMDSSIMNIFNNYLGRLEEQIKED